MIPSRTVVLAGALVVAAIGWFVAPAAFGRSLKAWELLVLAAASAGILQWQRSRGIRRMRREEDSMRDSALW
ncbi:hypothetical protein ACPWT1_11680 [Ramlibacter sp. MMS24-I3-19]|uniref:hypothetical protein n=1 Tax=Ramlibacter sp. MMS24-I3-19 TaxID=3416606 RepID=UPI003D0751D7